jgi:hypothetical protein
MLRESASEVELYDAFDSFRKNTFCRLAVERSVCTFVGCSAELEEVSQGDTQCAEAADEESIAAMNLSKPRAALSVV